MTGSRVGTKNFRAGDLARSVIDPGLDWREVLEVGSAGIRLLLASRPSVLLPKKNYRVAVEATTCGWVHCPGVAAPILEYEYGLAHARCHRLMHPIAEPLET